MNYSKKRKLKDAGLARGDKASKAALAKADQSDLMVKKGKELMTLHVQEKDSAADKKKQDAQTAQTKENQRADWKADLSRYEESAKEHAADVRDLTTKLKKANRYKTPGIKGRLEKAQDFLRDCKEKCEVLESKLKLGA